MNHYVTSYTLNSSEIPAKSRVACNRTVLPRLVGGANNNPDLVWIP